MERQRPERCCYRQTTEMSYITQKGTTQGQSACTAANFKSELFEEHLLQEECWGDDYNTSGTINEFKEPSQKRKDMYADPLTFRLFSQLGIRSIRVETRFL